MLLVLFPLQFWFRVSQISLEKNQVYIYLVERRKLASHFPFKNFQSHFLVASLSRDNNGILMPLRDVNCRPYWLWNSSLLSHTQTHNAHIFLSLAFLRPNEIRYESFHFILEWFLIKNLEKMHFQLKGVNILSTGKKENKLIIMSSQFERN